MYKSMSYALVDRSDQLIYSDYIKELLCSLVIRVQFKGFPRISISILLHQITVQVAFEEAVFLALCVRLWLGAWH